MKINLNNRKTKKKSNNFHLFLKNKHLNSELKKCQFIRLKIKQILIKNNGITNESHQKNIPLLSLCSLNVELMNILKSSTNF